MGARGNYHEGEESEFGRGSNLHCQTSLPPDMTLIKQWRSHAHPRFAVPIQKDKRGETDNAAVRARSIALVGKQGVIEQDDVWP